MKGTMTNTNHTAEEVRAFIAHMDATASWLTPGERDIAAAYAALLERREAGVTDEACHHDAWEENGGWRKCVDCGYGWPASVEPDDQSWDDNAERLTREAGIGGGSINLHATSTDDIFIPPAEPAQPADSGRVRDENDAATLQRLGDDAAKWASEFRATAVRLGYSDMDEGWLIGWFANAIEYSGDVRRWRAEAALAAQGQPAEPVAQAETIKTAARECSRHAYAYWHDGPESATYYEHGLPNKEAHEAPYANIIRRAFAAQPRAVPAERVPEGMVLVPRDMTAAQELAMVAAWNNGPHAVREAMLAASQESQSNG